MHCYNCPGYPLKPVKLEHDLPARECHRCGGLHIDLLSYRSWRDNRTHEAGDGEDLRVEPTENNKALICQRCSKIMLKYRISTDHENYIDLCTSCDDAWLDGGEWQLLKHLDIRDKLTHIMTEPWQRHIKEEEFRRFQDEKLKGIFGIENLEKINEISDWINDQENSFEIVNYLRRRVKT